MRVFRIASRQVSYSRLTMSSRNYLTGRPLLRQFTGIAGESAACRPTSHSSATYPTRPDGRLCIARGRPNGPTRVCIAIRSPAVSPERAANRFAIATVLGESHVVVGHADRPVRPDHHGADRNWGRYGRQPRRRTRCPALSPQAAGVVALGSRSICRHSSLKRTRCLPVRRPGVGWTESAWTWRMWMRGAIFVEIGRKAERVLIVSEGLLIYLSAEEVGALARDLARPASFRFWVNDVVSPGLLKMLDENLGAMVAAGGAAFKFGPEVGPAFLQPFGWRPRDVRSLLKAAAKLKRLTFGMRLIALLPESNGRQGKRHGRPYACSSGRDHAWAFATPLAPRGKPIQSGQTERPPQHLVLYEQPARFDGFAPTPQSIAKPAVRNSCAAARFPTRRDRAGREKYSSFPDARAMAAGSSIASRQTRPKTSRS